MNIISHLNVVTNHALIIPRILEGLVEVPDHKFIETFPDVAVLIELGHLKMGFTLFRLQDRRLYLICRRLATGMNRTTISQRSWTE